MLADILCRDISTAYELVNVSLASCYIAFVNYHWFADRLVVISRGILSTEPNYDEL